jgi:hypothetical protein
LKISRQIVVFQASADTFEAKTLHAHLNVVKADSAANFILKHEKQLRACLEKLHYQGKYLIQAGFDEDLLQEGILEEIIFITLEANLFHDLADDEDCDTEISQVFGPAIGGFIAMIITPSKTLYAYTTPQVSKISPLPCVDADGSKSTPTSSLGVNTNLNLSGSGQASLPIDGGGNQGSEESRSSQTHWQTRIAGKNKGTAASTELRKKWRKLNISFYWQTKVSDCQMPSRNQEKYFFTMKPSITLTVRHWLFSYSWDHTIQNYLFLAEQQRGPQ